MTGSTLRELVVLVQYDGAKNVLLRRRSSGGTHRSNHGTSRFLDKFCLGDWTGWLRHNQWLLIQVLPQLTYPRRQYNNSSDILFLVRTTATMTEEEGGEEELAVENGGGDEEVEDIVQRRIARATQRTPRANIPLRTKSAITAERKPLQRTATDAVAPRGKRGNLKRCATSADSSGGTLQQMRHKKKGIRVAITVRKQDITSEEEPEETAKSQTPGEDLNLYQMEVHTSGKFHRKVCWPDIDCFWGDSHVINKDTMCDLLSEYTQLFYPERRGVDNIRPKRCYIKDEPLRGISFYKDYDWDPVKLCLKTETSNKHNPNERPAVEILERYTRTVELERIPVNFETSDINAILVEQGDKAVTSTLIKSKLQGHPLALAMMTSETQIIVELRGLESVVGVLGNDETPHDVNPETGEQIWRDVKTLRALLYDKPLPHREGKGQHRILEVVGLESYLKARVYYKAYVEGDIVSDHGVGLLLGERWWAHPLKDIMSGYELENAAYVYEDIELRFFSEIGYKMDNEYFDWENHKGKWVKVKKTRQPASS
jgi:hypothetical protein